jgi:hypothetical protein
MKQLIYAGAVVVSLFGCSSPTPTTAPSSTAATTPAPPPPPPPILPANLIVPSNATFDVPNCQGKAAAAALLNLPTVTCLTFTGTMQNTGSGCAGSVSGTTTTSTLTGQNLGVATWTASGIVRPGATLVYSGGQITIATSTSYNYRTVATWTNVACS